MLLYPSAFVRGIRSFGTLSYWQEHAKSVGLRERRTSRIRDCCNRATSIIETAQRLRLILFSTPRCRFLDHSWCIIPTSILPTVFQFPLPAQSVFSVSCHGHFLSVQLTDLLELLPGVFFIVDPIQLPSTDVIFSPSIFHVFSSFVVLWCIVAIFTHFLAQTSRGSM